MAGLALLAAGSPLAAQVLLHDEIPVVASVYRQPRPASGGAGPTMAQQVDTVLGWLDLPAGKRPALIRLHFSAVDNAGHLSGPDSPAGCDRNERDARHSPSGRRLGMIVALGWLNRDVSVRPVFDLAYGSAPVLTPARAGLRANA